MPLALSQQAPVPPPKPPQEPVAVQTYRLEVNVLQGSQPVPGIRALLYKLGPAGRAVPVGTRGTARISGADGRMSWEGLVETGLMLQLRDPRTGLSLTLPLTGEYLASPLTIGPYQIRLRTNP